MGKNKALAHHAVIYHNASAYGFQGYLGDTITTTTETKMFRN